MNTNNHNKTASIHEDTKVKSSNRLRQSVASVFICLMTLFLFISFEFESSVHSHFTSAMSVVCGLIGFKLMAPKSQKI